jgi:hypothetical protein
MRVRIATAAVGLQPCSSSGFMSPPEVPKETEASTPTSRARTVERRLAGAAEAIGTVPAGEAETIGGVPAGAAEAVIGAVLAARCCGLTGSTVLWR